MNEAGIINRCYQRFIDEFTPFKHSFIYEQTRILLALPRGHFHGKFIYTLGPKGRITEKQAMEIDHLSRQGYAVEFCRGLEPAWDAISSYLTWSGD